MVRAIGFLASFVAVVGGCVAVVGWLDTRDVPVSFIGAILVSMGLALLLVRRAVIPDGQSAFDAWRHNNKGSALAMAVGAGFGGAWIFIGGGGVLPLVGAAILLAFSAWPLAWDLYERDKASRKVCPDCCEEVKAGARVCRYCGYRWAERPAPIPPIEPDRPQSTR